MSSVQLVHKIELLPEMLQAQVADFVDFLLNKNFRNKPVPTTEEPELTAAQKTELDLCYQEYLENPESVVSIEILKTRLLQKYGLQPAS